MKTPLANNEKGIALVIALIMLLVLTLIGIGSIDSSVFETKISGNERIGSAAFYAAAGGADVGIDQIPSLASYSSTIGSDVSYRSGKMTDSSQQPQTNLGLITRAGYENVWSFTRYQINATGFYGNSSGAMKEVETQISFGPYGGGTVYNN